MHAVSLSTFTTCCQSLQTVGIHKIVQHFAGSDLVKQANQELILLAYVRLTFIYLKEKENFRQVSTCLIEIKLLTDIIL